MRRKQLLWMIPLFFALLWLWRPDTHMEVMQPEMPPQDKQPRVSLIETPVRAVEAPEAGDISLVEGPDQLVLLEVKGESGRHLDVDIDFSSHQGAEMARVAKGKYRFTWRPDTASQSELRTRITHKLYQQTYELLTVQSAAEATWQVVTLKERGDLVGLVLDPDEQPLPGVKVAGSMIKTLTDENGRFELKGCDSDEIYVHFTKEGYHHAVERFDVPGEETIILPFQGRFDISVVDKISGDRLKGVELKLLHPEFDPIEKFAHYGSAWENVAYLPGWMIEVAAHGYVSETFGPFMPKRVEPIPENLDYAHMTYEEVLSKDEDLTLSMTRQPWTSGLLVDPEGEPLAGAYIYALDFPDWGWVDEETKAFSIIDTNPVNRQFFLGSVLHQTITDEEGRFQLAPTEEAQNFAIAVKGGGAARHVFVSPEKQGESWHLVAPRGATLKVHFDSSVFEEAAHVLLERAGKSPIRLSNFRKDGVVEGTGLPAGTYRVSLFARGSANIASTKVTLLAGQHRELVLPSQGLVKIVVNLKTLDWEERFGRIQGVLTGEQLHTPLIDSTSYPHFSFWVPTGTYSLELADLDYSLFESKGAKSLGTYPIVVDQSLETTIDLPSQKVTCTFAKDGHYSFSLRRGGVSYSMKRYKNSDRFFGYNIPKGTYELCVTGMNGYERHLKTVRITGAEHQDLGQFSYDHTGGIRLYLPPLNGPKYVRVQLFEEENLEANFEQFWPTTGEMVCRNIRPGLYQVKVEGYLMASSQEKKEAGLWTGSASVAIDTEMSLLSIEMEQDQFPQFRLKLEGYNFYPTTSITLTDRNTGKSHKYQRNGFGHHPNQSGLYWTDHSIIITQLKGGPWLVELAYSNGLLWQREVDAEGGSFILPRFGRDVEINYKVYQRRELDW